MASKDRAGESVTGGLISCLGYKDADAAVDWLCKAFGFVLAPSIAMAGARSCMPSSRTPIQ